MQWLTNLLSGSKNSDREIRNIFFKLIQDNQGSITVIDFAVAADISGTDAKKILEQFAVEFDANFDVTEQGQVVYLFPTTSNPTPKEILSEVKRSSSSLEPNNNHKNKEQSSFTNINEDIKQKVNKINNDVKQKVEGIKKIEDDLKEMGASINDLFKF